MERISLQDVLTLEEASVYLRLPIEAVLRQVLQGNIPDRNIEQPFPSKLKALSKLVNQLMV